MTTKSTIKQLETKANAHLAALPAEKRPKTSFGTRIRSIAYSTRAFFEATDGNGSTEFVSVEVVKGWLS